MILGPDLEIDRFAGFAWPLTLIVPPFFSSVLSIAIVGAVVAAISAGAAAGAAVASPLSTACPVLAPSNITIARPSHGRILNLLFIIPSPC